MTKDSSIAVIGSGPAGLAVSALLSRRGIAHTVYDKQMNAGGLYAHLNPELKLLSPTCFNSLPLVKYNDTAGHNTVGNYARYLQEYIELNQPPLKLNTTITNINKERDHYRLLTDDNESILHTKVIVATGMASHAKPLDFTVPDAIEVQDAIELKSVKYYQNKNIMVIGSGTSAFEIVSLLVDTTKLWLATNKPIASSPLTILGINIHFFVRPLELIPISWFPGLCQRGFREQAISQDINKLVSRQRVKVINTPPKFENQRLVYSPGMSEPVDIIINCTGYKCDSHIMPSNIARHENGNIKTRQCQSVSHPGLFLIGHPCVGGLDSKFLRGIRRDASRIVHQTG